MKKLLYILLLLIQLPVLLSAQQNLTNNGSFEQYTTCPNSLSLVSNCFNWRQYTSGTSDYFNECTTSPFVDVPKNSFGFQYAAQGQAYMGLADANTYREYVAGTITPLTPGYKYRVSISVSLSNGSLYGTNDLGVYFYDSGPSTVTTSGVLNVTPQVLYSNYAPVTDTAGWVRLTKVFEADSAYDNIVIGTFLPYNVQQRDTIQTSAGLTCYYYIDSVVIRLADSFTVTNVDCILCAGDTFNVSYYTPEAYKANNIFTAQLSDKTGSFSSPVNIGSRASDLSGTITCIVPADISNGAGYKVRVIASNQSDTTKNISPDIRIANPDSFAITVTNNTPLCQGNSINFSVSTNIAQSTFNWSGPNGFNSTSATPFINGASPVHNGNYYVTTQFHGCQRKDTTTVTVKPLPVKPVANSNSPLCAGDNLQLTVGIATSTNYSWTGPAGFTSAVQNPVRNNTTTAMSGDYIVTADSNGCNRKDTVAVVVKPVPSSITTSNNTPLCAGDTLKIFSTNSSSGVSYTWSGPASYSSATQNSSRANSTAAMTGWYKMSVDLNGCTTTDSTFANVYPIPTTPTISYNSPLCIGETLSLNATTVNGATYSWTGPGNYSANTQNPTRTNMQFGDTGTYKIVVIANGCISSEGSMKVNLNPTPFVVILANPADSICQGDPVVFTALPNNHGGTPNYQWKVNAQNAGTGTVFNTTTLNDGDVILCEMTENTKCSVPYKDESNDIQMTVLPWLSPSVSITANPTHPLDQYEYVTFTAATTNAGKNPKYQWKRNGQDIVGATGNIWSANTLNDNDSISVEIISDYKCPQPTTAKSNWIRVHLTGVDDIATISGLKLYPNPNNGRFTLIVEGVNADATLAIINTLGQTIYTERLTVNGTFKKEIDLQNVVTGIYLLRLKNNNGETSVLRFRVE